MTSAAGRRSPKEPTVMNATNDADAAISTTSRSRYCIASGETAAPNRHAAR